MLFTSLWYWLFLALVATLYFNLPLRAAVVVLGAAGFVFYGFWDWRFVFLLAGATAFNFLTGIALDQSSGDRARRMWLTVAVAGNLGILSIFKYYDFFAGSLAQAFGDDPQHWMLRIILPVGVSFYSFEGIAYNIDVYRRVLAARRDILDFALFISFFPHLIAGPIIQPARFFPQLAARHVPSADETRWAIVQVFKGLIKKTVFADNFASLADAYFNGPIGYSGAVPALIGVVSFSMQIYFDFAGYTDIARGSAKLLGFDFPPNFERPYLATNIADFWRRWHISLSTWLRIYLYVPLGGSRKSGGRTYVNLMLVMTLGGLWHGASWNFVVWGAYHGLLLMCHRVFRWLIAGTRAEPLTESRAWSAIGTGLTFTLVTLGWITFRTSSFGETLAVLGDLRSWVADYELRPGFVAMLLAIALWLLIDRRRRVQDWFVAGGVVRESAGVAACLLILALLSRPDVALPFIYFQF